MIETKLKLITALKKSLDLMNVDNVSDVYVCGNEIQTKINGFYIRIYQDRLYENKDSYVYQYKISHGYSSEILSDDEFKELFQLCDEKYQKVNDERLISIKKTSEEELDNFIK